MAGQPLNAALRRRILLHLTKQVEPSVSELARVLETSRPSVSRAVKALERAGQIMKSEPGLGLTDAGRAAGEAIEREEQARARRMTQEYQRVLGQQAKLAPMFQDRLRWAETLISSFSGLDEIRRAMVQNTSMTAQLREMSAMMTAAPLKQITESIQAARTEQMTEAVNSLRANHLSQAMEAVQSLRQSHLQEIGDALKAYQQASRADLAEQINALRQHYQHSFASFTKLQFTEVLDAIGAAQRQHTDYLDRLRFDFRSFVSPALSPWLEDVHRRARIRRAFAVAGFVPANSMAPELIQRMVDAYEAGLGASELEQLIVAFYDAEDCAPIAAIVEQLCGNPFFAGREQTLRDALAAHRAGLDAIGVYPLTSMVEGVAVPVFSKLAGGKPVKHNRIAEILKNQPLIVLQAVSSEAIGCMITYLTEHLYRFHDWRVEQTASQDQQSLNRHRLAHGWARRGERADTIRCFLLLEVLGAILPALEEWATADDSEHLES